jgi:hypothetical protein
MPTKVSTTKTAATGSKKRSCTKCESANSVKELKILMKAEEMMQQQ